MNITFPVINSTLAPAQLASWVAEQYGWTNVSCRLLKTNMNDSYVIATNDNQYLLRIYNHAHRNNIHVSEEVTLLNTLKQHLNVAYPIADAKGEFINQINAPEGLRFVVMFSFAEGEILRHTNIAINHTIGSTVGLLHKATLNKTTKRTYYNAQTLVGWAYIQAEKYIDLQLAEMKFIKNSEHIIARAFEQTSLRSGIVHLDIWYPNMSIKDNNTITLFDFDNIGNGNLILDIGYYCMQLYYVEEDKAAYEEKKAAFIEGYRSVTSLPESELALIPYAGLAIWIHYLGVQAQRFDSFANIFLSENYLKMYIGRVTNWLKYHNIEIPKD